MNDMVRVMCCECNEGLDVSADTKMHCIGECPTCGCDAWIVDKRDTEQCYSTAHVERVTGATRARLSRWAKDGIVNPKRQYRVEPHKGFVKNRDSYLWSREDVERVAAIVAQIDKGLTLKAAVEHLA